jgi:hypothetical protein
MLKAGLMLAILVISVISVSFSLNGSTIVPSSGSIYYPTEAKVLFEDGFESGNFSVWDGTYTTSNDYSTVASIYPYEGTYHSCFETHATPSGVKYAYCYRILSPTVSEVYARAYFYIEDGLPLDDNDDRFGLISFEVGGQSQCTFRVRRSGGVDKFDVIGYDGISTVSKSTDAVYPVEGQWYCIEFYIKVHSSTGEYRAWINGVEQITMTNLDTTRYGTGVSLVRFGLTYTANVQHSVIVYCDSVVISTRYIGQSTILFEDGFESGNFNAWNGTFITAGDSATVASTNPYEGIYHGHFKTDSIVSGVKYAYVYKTLSEAVAEVYARAYFYIVDGLPLNDDDDRFGLISFEVGGQSQCTFRVRRSGGVDKFNIIGYDGISTVSKSTDAVYPVEGQWYCIEFYIRVDSAIGEYRAWVNGIEQITITNLDTTRYGTGVNNVRFGLTYTANVQHSVELHCDSVVVSNHYVGQLKLGVFGVIGSVTENPAIRNFYYLFGNQSISYKCLLPSEVSTYQDVDRFDGLVVWTRQGGYNSSAVRDFAKTHVVISHVWDFCNFLYPSLRTSTEIVTTNTVTYLMDWGNFRRGNLVEMRNETGNIDRLTTVLASGLTGFTNITTIACYDSSRVAFFRMNGAQSKSGFYVMDLDATTPETEWAGIWHLFPAIKMVKDFPTGMFARWMANGQRWWDLAWIYSWMANFTNANNDIVRMASIGKSVSNRDINALYIGNGSRYAIIDGSIHGNEKTTSFACLRLAEIIMEDYRAGGYWYHRLKELKVIIIPVLNPDGYVRNWRYNDNGIDLNRNFPPGGNASEPETKALVNLMDNYPPIIYVNNHEGRYYDPNEYWYNYLEKEPSKSFTITALKYANLTFTELQHWGRYTEGGLNLWLGSVRLIGQVGAGDRAHAYPAWKYNTSSVIVESIVWSSDHYARQSLWGIDYYVSASIALLTHLDKLFEEKFILHSTAKIESFAFNGQLRVEMDSSELTSPSLSKIHVGAKGKPLTVTIDGLEKAEGDGWAYDNYVLTITGARYNIEIFW